MFEQKNVVMNRWLYHLSNIIFNILSVIVVIFLYSKGVFGTVTENLVEIVMSYVESSIGDPVDLGFILVIGILLVIALIQRLRKGEDVSTTTFNLRTFNIIFVPILVALIIVEIVLMFFVPGSAFLVAFVMLFSNMVLFLVLYTNKLHEYAERVLLI